MAEGGSQLDLVHVEDQVKLANVLELLVQRLNKHLYALTELATMPACQLTHLNQIQDTEL